MLVDQNINLSSPKTPGSKFRSSGGPYKSSKYSQDEKMNQISAQLNSDLNLTPRNVLE